MRCNILIELDEVTWTKMWSKRITCTLRACARLYFQLLANLSSCKRIVHVAGWRLYGIIQHDGIAILFSGLAMNSATKFCEISAAIVNDVIWTEDIILLLTPLHYSDVIMSTMEFQIAILRLSTQPFIQVQIKENMKALRHWPLWGEFTGGWWISRTKGQ